MDFSAELLIVVIIGCAWLNMVALPPFSLSHYLFNSSLFLIFLLQLSPLTVTLLMVRWHNTFQAQACSNGDPHVWSMTLVQNSVWVDIFSQLFSRPVPNPPVAHICLQISAFNTSQQGDDNELIQGNWIQRCPLKPHKALNARCDFYDMSAVEGCFRKQGLVTIATNHCYLI